MPKQEQICQQCGKRYEGYSNQKYCDAKCRQMHRNAKKSPNVHKPRECPNCGIVFGGATYPPGKRIYCSTACKSEYNDHKRFPHAHRARECPNCGKTFGGDSGTPGKRKFCSAQCTREYHSKIRSPNMLVERECVNCGKIFGGNSGVSRRQKHCSPRCAREYENKQEAVKRREAYRKTFMLRTCSRPQRCIVVRNSEYWRWQLTLAAREFEPPPKRRVILVCGTTK